ncbi:MAG: GNAT family N-acetyltransferase, partial [Burkholderiales bacterium]|nr:GNAT family N-acetyltransferase [Burkholderiales bacterium]
LLREADRPAEVIAARFAQGARCLAAAKQGRLAGFLWFVVGPYEEDEVRARFVPEPAGAASWDFDVMVLPQYRMGRLFSYLWTRANAELAKAGVRHTMSRISAFNAGSLASHQRLGATIAGSALFVCAGRLQVMRSSLRPHWHVSWRPDQRPVLIVAAAGGAVSKSDPIPGVVQ